MIGWIILVFIYILDNTFLDNFFFEHQINFLLFVCFKSNII